MGKKYQIRKVGVSLGRKKKVRPVVSHFCPDTPLVQRSTSTIAESPPKRRELTPNTTTTTIDLLPELWLEILSYLSRIYQWRMRGISRTLYGMALPEIFRKLDLAYADSGAMWQLDYCLK